MIMNYEKFQEHIVDYLSGNLTDDDTQKFEQFLKDYPEYLPEYESAQFLWQGSDAEIPSPTTAMDTKFYQMLNSESKEKEGKLTLFQKIEQLLFGNLPKQLAYTLVILIAGFFVGKEFITSGGNLEEQVIAAKQETQEVRSQLVLTLLDQPSANKRLQAVSEASKLDQVTETIIKALFSTLNNDPNVNVRLSAIEALKNYISIPEVREGLVASIIHQKSPIVQIELADLMTALQEKKAVKSFEKLMEDENINVSAKQKIEQSIKEIY